MPARRQAISGDFSLAQQYFAEQDDRFLDALRAVHKPQQLLDFVPSWLSDDRPWARKQLEVYLQLPLDQIGHQVIVKRVFKHAEAAGDDALMAMFLAAFDRLVRHGVRQDYMPRNTLPRLPFRTYTDWRGQEHQWPVYTSMKDRLFTYRTRYYLRRRAWRYFRRLGFQRPHDYVAVIAAALACYRDDDLVRGQDILDSWGLMQICFRYHPALTFGASKIRLLPGRSLQELSPAPRFPEACAAGDAAHTLWELAGRAQAGFVRSWCMALLTERHNEYLRDRPAGDIACLLSHADEQVQAFGAACLELSRYAPTWSVEQWLSLLESPNPTVLATVCTAMQRHIHAETLSLPQCVELACAKAAPVARLGLTYLQQRELAGDADRQTLVNLAQARCPALAAEIAKWALLQLPGATQYDADHVTPFFDSALNEMREAAWTWLHAAGAASPAWQDALLWSRLFETPYDDVRLRLIEALEAKQYAHTPLKRAGNASAPAVSVAPRESLPLTQLWSSVLLNIHRGNRYKRRALLQLCQALRDRPEDAPQLLPVFAVAIRSVRATERRAGLAALVQALQQRPELEDAVSRYLPELNLYAAVDD